MEKTILFPTDFSDRADHALSEALAIAKAFSARLIIFHAYHRPVFKQDSKYDPEMLLKKAEIQIEKQFESLEASHPGLEEVNHEFRKEIGVSVRKITELVKSEDIDLVIMATKGARDFGELLGSKAARTLKSVNVPVLVFPDDTSLTGLKKLALACDYSKESDLKTLQFLTFFAEKLKLGVDVVSLNRDERMLTDEEKQTREEVKGQLQSLPHSLNYSFNDSVAYGILDYAKEHDIGLIAIIPKSYNFVERLFHESLTKKLAFHSPLPLLVL